MISKTDVLSVWTNEWISPKMKRWMNENCLFFIEMMFASYLNITSKRICMKINGDWMNINEFLIEWMEEWKNTEWTKCVCFSVVLPDVFDSKISQKTVSHYDWGCFSHQEDSAC